jgi:hypothetical protein
LLMAIVGEWESKLSRMLFLFGWLLSCCWPLIYEAIDMICFALLVSVAVVALTLTLTELHSEVCASVIFLLAHVIERSFMVTWFAYYWWMRDWCVVCVVFTSSLSYRPPRPPRRRPKKPLRRPRKIAPIKFSVPFAGNYLQL